MKKINLKWDADGAIESYSVYRSETRINSNSLPVPLVTGLKEKTYEDSYEGSSPRLHYVISSNLGNLEKVSSEIIVQLSTTTVPFEISCEGAVSEIVLSPFNSNDTYQVVINNEVLGNTDAFSNGGLKEILANHDIEMEGLDNQNNVVTNYIDNTVTRVRFKNLNSTNKKVKIISNTNNKINQNLTPNNITFGINGTNTSEVTFCLSGYTQELRDFDYAVLRYIWTDNGGKDLDTRTSISNPPRNTAVGWNRGEGDLTYLTWGGDNTGSGVESVLLNIKDLKLNYPLQTQFETTLKAFWYSSKITGDFKVQFESYKGGTMIKNGYDFINNGGISIQTLTVDCNSSTVINQNIDGDLVATLTYDSLLNTGILSANRG